LGDIKQQLSLYQERAGFLSDVNRGIVLLKHDFNQAHRAEVAGRSIYLDSPTGAVFTYHFEPNYLIRENSITPDIRDTFPLATLVFNPFFAGNRVVLSNELNQSTSKLTDHLAWQFNLLEQTKSLHLRKEYATLELIED
jgi:hypothetical protein